MVNTNAIVKRRKVIGSFEVICKLSKTKPVREGNLKSKLKIIVMNP